MAVITSEYDLTIKLGGDFSEEFTLGFDISTWTIKSQIRSKQKLSSSLIATFLVTVIDAETGVFTLSLTDTETSQIPSLTISKKGRSFP